MTPLTGPRIRVYTADIAPLREKGLFARAYSAVSPRRREKTDRLRFESDKCLSLGAELLLMRACRDLGIAYEAETVTESTYKKPAFASGRVAFNLSHSGTKVLCAAADVPVGCDTERIGDADPQIAERFFFKDERLALSAAASEAERRALFYRLWTLKESFMKCTGLGFYLPLDSFCVLTDGPSVTVRQQVDGACYRFFERHPGDGYAYAVCVRLPDEHAPCPAPVWEQAVLSEALPADTAEK